MKGANQVGPSGGGKTTLIKLLLRVYDACEGTILLDDRPLQEFDLKSWRRRIGLVSQDVFVFNTTVRENIAYGLPDASEEEIVEAAEKLLTQGDKAVNSWQIKQVAP